MELWEYGWVLLGMTMMFFGPYLAHKLFDEEKKHKFQRWIKRKLN